MALDPSTGQTIYDPETLAKLQAQQDQAGTQSELARQLMQAGYVPNSGKLGAFSQGLQSMIGALMLQNSQSQMQEVYKGKIEAATAAEKAKRAQDLQDMTHKTDEEIRKGVGIAGGSADAKAQVDLKYGDQMGAQAANAAGLKAGAESSANLPNQEALAKYTKQQEAAYRQAPEFQQKIALAQKLGASPDQIKAMVLGDNAMLMGGPMATAAQGGATGDEYLKQLPTTQAAQPSVTQGVLEGSNVPPVLEVTQMMNDLRDYQFTTQLIQAEDDRIQSTIEKMLTTNA